MELIGTEAEVYRKANILLGRVLAAQAVLERAKFDYVVDLKSEVDDLEDAPTRALIHQTDLALTEALLALKNARSRLERFTEALEDN